MSTDNNKTKHTRQSILKGLRLGFGGIFVIGEFPRKPFEGAALIWAYVAWGLLSIATFLLGVPVYDLIVDMVNQMIVWIPCILGFTIGGYSFLIGFVQPGLMQKISEPQQNSDFSFFQKTSAVFACNVMLQAISLAFAFVVHYIIYLDTKKSVKFVLPRGLATFFNEFAFLLVGLTFAISLAVVAQLIVNVFNFSQLHHYNVNMEKLENEKDPYLPVVADQDQTEVTPE